MIKYESFRLSNGLRVHVIPDKTVKTAIINLAYDVGSRDEVQERTGFAHLFEHLMFGGSANIPEYDSPLQKVGGENNAFTTSDYTNYYLTLPSNNIETGFWLESDRMLNLSFDPKVLEVQRKVVIEEFKQRYLNKPYGDAWHKLRPVAYQNHPYRWPVIGDKISHIEDAKMEDVKGFFDMHYTPDRAVLVVAGDVEVTQVQDLCAKWFEPIKKQSNYIRNLPVEDPQKEMRKIVFEADVPQEALYYVFHMPGKNSKDYFATDLLSDVLGRGKSSRLHQQLVKEKEIFTSISASIMGTMDPGLIAIQGFVKEGISLSEAEKNVSDIVLNLSQVEDLEYLKTKNQALSSLYFSKVELLEQAMSLTYSTLLGNPNHTNEEENLIENVQKEDILEAANRYLRRENSSILHYSKKN